MYDSGFGYGIPDFGSVCMLLCAFKTTMIEMENNLSFEASDSKWPFMLIMIHLLRLVC